MENREIYVSDGCYRLCRLTENDKEEYMNLLRETNAIPGFYDNQANCNIMWQLSIYGMDWEFSIFDKEDNYCGNIMLKSPESDHPEIGIDIVRRYRNQGIAPKAIKMLARRTYEDKVVEYYIIRVSSKNQHSKHVMEKLGVVPDDSEDVYIKRLANNMMQILGEDSYEKVKKKVEKIVHIDDEIINQYRYLPEVFLK